MRQFVPSRRRFLRASAAMGLLSIGPPMLNRGQFRVFAANERSYSKRTVELIARSIVLDLISPIEIGNQFSEGWWRDSPSQFSSKVLLDMRRSGITAFNSTVAFDGPTAFDKTLKFAVSANSFVNYLSSDFVRVDSLEDLHLAKASGRLGILIGTQDATHFRTTDDVDLFYKYGQRMAQLTYNTRNLVGSGCTERRDDGLSEYGLSVVARMNDLGMAVDLSHCGDCTTMDGIEASRLPVFVTHSNARALNPGHPRCKTDEAIRALAKKGGIFGVTNVRMFVKNSEPTTIEDVLNHYDYIAKLVGVEHLAVGTDSDLHGFDVLPEEVIERLKTSVGPTMRWRDRIDIEGLNGPQKMFELVEGLIRRGYTDSHIEGILGANAMRVLGQVWKPKTPLVAA